MGVKRYLSLYPSFLAKNLRESLAYKADFIMGVTAHLLIQTTGILFLSIIFSRVSSLNGWTYYQTLALYGFALIPSGLEQFFLHNIWSLPGSYIRLGNLDRILLRPMHPLFIITMDGTSLHGFINTIYGAVVFGIAVNRLDIGFDMAKMLWLIVFSISGMFIYFAIMTIMATFSFWFIDVMSGMVLVDSLNQFLKYPLSIFSKFIKGLLTFVIPYAFTSFYPAAFLLDKTEYRFFSWMTPAVALIMFIIAVKFFKFGLKSYKSAGG